MSLEDYEYGLDKIDIAGMGGKKIDELIPLGLRALTLLEYEARLVSGTLTADGVQYLAEVTSGAADTWVDAFTKVIEPGIFGAILWAELGLTAEFQELNTTTTLTWQWQARNKGGTWVDLHPAVTEGANTITSYTARTRQGFASLSSNFNQVPYEIKLRFKTSEANQGKARVKSSSYARAVFRAI